MSTPVDVAVVVVTYNSADLIADLVGSIPAGLEGLQYCLIVADNASTDGTVDRVRTLTPDSLVVETGRNGGYAAGINAALAEAPPHAAALILNPDVRLAPGAVAALLNEFQDAAVGIAVPRLLDAQGQLISSQRREPTLLRAWADALLSGSFAGRFRLLGEVVTDPRLYESAIDTDWAEGSTLLVRSECATACGPWDESFFLYSEETEYALRARDAGYRTRFTPAATAIHLEGGSSPELTSLLIMNRVRLYRRRHGPTATALFWAAQLVWATVRASVGQPAGRATARALISPSRFRETPGPEAVRRRSPARARMVSEGV